MRKKPATSTATWLTPSPLGKSRAETAQTTTSRVIHLVLASLAGLMSHPEPNTRGRLLMTEPFGSDKDHVS